MIYNIIQKEVSDMKENVISILAERGIELNEEEAETIKEHWLMIKKMRHNLKNSTLEESNIGLINRPKGE